MNKIEIPDKILGMKDERKARRENFFCQSCRNVKVDAKNYQSVQLVR
jgi:hypothetical protein